MNKNSEIGAIVRTGCLVNKIKARNGIAGEKLRKFNRASSPRLFTEAEVSFSDTTRMFAGVYFQSVYKTNVPTSDT